VLSSFGLAASAMPSSEVGVGELPVSNALVAAGMLCPGKLLPIEPTEIAEGTVCFGVVAVSSATPVPLIFERLGVVLHDQFWSSRSSSRASVPDS
jgi:hypothetical protein